MSNLITIQKVANELGVSTKTLRRWEESGQLVPDEREQGTNIRLYHPYKIQYWGKLLKLDRTLKEHLKLLDGLRKELDKHNLEQTYNPNKPLKLMTEEDVQHFLEASDKMDKWEKDFRTLLDEILKFPKNMLQATKEDYDEDKK